MFELKIVNSACTTPKMVSKWTVCLQRGASHPGILESFGRQQNEKQSNSEMKPIKLSMDDIFHVGPSDINLPVSSLRCKCSYLRLLGIGPDAMAVERWPLGHSIRCQNQFTPERVE